MTIQENKYSVLVQIFIVSFVSLFLEIQLIKTCDVLVNPSTGYFLISLVLCILSCMGALSASGIAKPKQHLNLLLALFLTISSLCLPSLSLFSYLVRQNNISESVLLSLLFILIIGLPFIFSGLCLFLLIDLGLKSHKFKILYSFDMLAAGIAAFTPIFIFPDSAPSMAVCWITIAAAVILFFSRGKSPSKLTSIYILPVTFSLLVIANENQVPFLRPLIHKYLPRSVTSAQLEYSGWDQMSKIDVVDFSNPSDNHGINLNSQAIKYLFFDGGSIGTNIYPFNGDFESLKESYRSQPERHFLRLGTVAAHYLKREQPHNAYLFGVGAGQEVKAALMYGAQSIYANELNTQVIRLSTHDYAKYNGGIFNDPRVHILIGDGRLQLQGLKEKFDIIQIFSNYLSSSMAAGNGGHLISYLFTEESLLEYLNKLTPDGILQINQFGYKKVLRLIEKAWVHLGNNPGDLENHLVVVNNTQKSDISTTILFKMSPFSENDRRDLQELFAISRPGPSQYSFQPLPNFRDSSWANELLSIAKDDKPFFGKNEILERSFLGITPVAILILLIGIVILLLKTTRRNGLSLDKREFLGYL